MGTRRTASIDIQLAMALVLAALSCASGQPVVAAESIRLRAENVESFMHALGFEGDSPQRILQSWQQVPEGVAELDRQPRSGTFSMRVGPGAGSPRATVARYMRAGFSGTALELRGFIRSSGSPAYASFFIRQDNEVSTLSSVAEPRAPRMIPGEWTEYRIAASLDPRTTEVGLGINVDGPGEVWVDDLQLLIDGKPLSAAVAETARDPVGDDAAFEDGSGIEIASLSNMQIDNLALLGRVWGFAKYHHPAITSGARNWDFDLFRIVPAILKAPRRTAAARLIVKWLDRLGPVEPCAPCATLPADLQLTPRVNWIRDNQYLGLELAQRLAAIYANRVPGKQRFVSLASGVGNPVFENELAYRGMSFPDGGYQLLALFRIWNIVEYWYPYRDLVGEGWHEVLRDSIAKVSLARTAEAYQLSLLALLARVGDGHANLWGGVGRRPPVGNCALAVGLRYLGGDFVVTKVSGKDIPFMPGDVIRSIGDVPVAKLVEQSRPFFGASNEAALMRDLSRSLTRGECRQTVTTVERDGSIQSLDSARVLLSPEEQAALFAHDRAGPAFEMLSANVGYLKLSSAAVKDLPGYLEKASTARGLIVDLRGYPAEFSVFELGGRLVRESTPFARFTIPDLSNPGAFRWGPPVLLPSKSPAFEKPVVVLVDENTQSQAEYTAMALRSSHATRLVGSTTAGADGNMSPFSAPGRYRAAITGIGVFYPDKSPTQRVGIVPDHVVVPSVASIREGSDAVLDEAVRLLLGTP